MDKAGKTSAKPAAAGSLRGQHRMMGEVTKIDESKGSLTLKTDEGELDLHFPPTALRGIKEGDRVEVQLAIRPAGATGAGAKAGSAGKASGTSSGTSGMSSGSGSAPKPGASSGSTSGTTGSGTTGSGSSATQGQSGSAQPKTQ
jgi:hypothetical protein